MSLLSLDQIPEDCQKVLLRVDFNVPLDKQFSITDDSRIRAALPTIQFLLQKNLSIILMSHLGRPKGKKNPEFSLRPCAKRLSELLHQEIKMAEDCVGPEVESEVLSLKPKEILMLENLRFYTAEENPEEDPSFAQTLASYADVYVNDAFGAAHRAHSSIVSIASFFKGRAFPGFLLKKEINFLGNAFENPKRPFYAIIGGAKVSSKLGVLKALIHKVDALFIGGAMSYTFLKAQNISIGNSLCEDALVEEAKSILLAAKEKNIPLYLPLDSVASQSSSDHSFQVFTTENGIPDSFQGLDIGPKTIQEWQTLLQKAKMIFWNGPLGVAEIEIFSKGTYSIAKAIADSQAVTIVGGGDSIAALEKLQMIGKMHHVSTGGGASLEYIEYGTLPGIEALKN